MEIKTREIVTVKYTDIQIKRELLKRERDYVAYLYPSRYLFHVYVSVTLSPRDAASGTIIRIHVLAHISIMALCNVANSQQL